MGAEREACAVELACLLENPSVRVFFGDEAGFEGDPRPRQRWVMRGSRPTQGYHGGHLRRNIVGAVEPATGHLRQRHLAGLHRGDQIKKNYHAREEEEELVPQILHIMRTALPLTHGVPVEVEHGTGPNWLAAH